MLEHQLSYVLQRHLGAYVTGLDAASLDVSVLRGDVTLTNLSLKPGALDFLELPLTVRAGLLGRLSLRIPWHNLKGSPVVVEVDRLYIIAGPADADAAARAGPATVAEAAAADTALKRRLVGAAELEWATSGLKGARAAAKGDDADDPDASPDDDDEKVGLLRGLADVVLGNLQVSITNVHVRYEDDGAATGAPPLAAGLTLARADALTVGPDGAPAFVTHDPLSVLRKAATLTRLALYFDAGGEPWPPPRGAASWAAVPPAAWDALFVDGVAAVPRADRPPPGRSPGGLALLAPGPAASRQYILRPVDGRALWTRCGPRARAAAAKAEGSPDCAAAQNLALDLGAVSLHLGRPQYLGARGVLEAVDAHRARAPARHLRPRARPGRADPSITAAWWYYAAAAVRKQAAGAKGCRWHRLLPALAVRRRYVDAYAAALAAGRLGGDTTTASLDKALDEASILAFRRLAHVRVEAGARRAAAAAAAAGGGRRSWGEWWRGEGGGAVAGAPTDAPPPSLSDLTDAERTVLAEAEASRAAAAAGGARTPTTLLARLAVSVDAASLSLDGDPGEAHVLHAGLHGASLEVGLYPSTTRVLVRVSRAGVVAPEGPLFTTAAPAGGAAVEFEFVRRPQDGRAEAALRVAAAPSFITIAPASARRARAFFAADRPLALPTLGAAAGAAAERARAAAAAALAAALADRPSLELSIDLDAPVLTLSMPGGVRDVPTALVVDLGTLRARTDAAASAGRPGVECFAVASSDVSAWIEEGEGAGSGGRGVAAGGASPAAASPSPRRILLLERCGASAAVDVPVGGGGGPISLALRVPALRFAASPGRAAWLGCALASLAPPPGPGGASLPPPPPWGSSGPELEGQLRVLERGALGARWSRARAAALFRGRLWLSPSPSPASLAAAAPHDAWAGRVAVRVPPAAVDGAAAFALVRPGADPARARADRDALVLSAPSTADARAWLKAIDRSAAVMRDLAGGGADAERAAALLAAADGGDGGGAPPRPPPPPLDLTAELGELSIVISGRPPLPWWTPDGPAPAAGGGEGECAGEARLAAVRARAGRASATLAPGGGVTAAVAIGAFDVEDLLVGGGGLHLARSARGGDGDRGDDPATPLSSRPSTAAPSMGTPYATPATAPRPPPTPDGDGDTFLDAADAPPATPDSPTSRAAAAAVGLDVEPAASLELTATPPGGAGEGAVAPVSVAVRLAGLDFWWRRPTVAALIAAGTDLVAAMAGRAAADGDVEGDGAATVGAAVTAAPTFALDLAVARLRVTFAYEDAMAHPLGAATVDALAVGVRVRPGGRVAITAALGNLTATDGSLPPGHRYRQAVGLRPGAADSLVTLALDCLPAADADGDARVPAGAPFFAITARLQALRVVYLNRLLQEALAYITLTFRLAPPPLESAAALPNLPPTTRPPTIVCVDLDADAPVVTMPRATDSEDAIEVDFGSLAVATRVAWRGGVPGGRAAALVETTTVRGAALAGRGVVAGVRGDNVVTRYDGGMSVTVSRPLIDAGASLPAVLAVAVDIPSIAAALTDAEYALCATVAADNVAEALRVPDAGRWMEAAHPVPDLEVVWVGGGASEPASPPPMESDGAGASAPNPPLDARTATRCTVRVGAAELRLARAARGAPVPLASLTLSELDVEWASDGAGGARLVACLPAAAATDERPGVPRARAAALAPGPPPAPGAPPPSLATLAWRRTPDGATSTRLALASPRVAAEPGFLLAALAFAAPASASRLRGQPPPYASQDVLLLDGETLALERDLHLSPSRRLLADGPGVRRARVDGCGHAIVLPPGVPPGDALPLILVGAGAVLEIANAALFGAESLPACLRLGPGGRLVADAAAGVTRVEGERSVAVIGSPERAHTSSASPLASPRPPVPPPAAPSMDICMDVHDAELCLVTVQAPAGDGARSSRASEGGGASRRPSSASSAGSSLALRFDCLITASTATDGGWSASADVRGLRADVRALADEGAPSPVARLLAPIGVSAHASASPGAASGLALDARLDATPLSVTITPASLALLAALNDAVLRPLAQPPPGEPLASCARFELVWAPEEGGEGGADATPSGPALWRPLPPVGYLSLGDAATRGVARPAFQVAVVAANSGLAAPPTRFDRAGAGPAGLVLWRPVPPPGFVALGCVASVGDTPPPRSAVACVAAGACVSAALGSCLPLPPDESAGTAADGGHVGDLPPVASLWCVDNAAATFAAAPAGGAPCLAALDLRSPMGSSPAVLLLALEARAMARVAAGVAGAARAAVGLPPVFTDFLAARRLALAAAATAGLRATAADWRRVWWDAGAGGRGGRPGGVSAWRAVPPPGYAALADAIVAGRDPPATAAVLLEGDGAGTAGGVPLLAAPTAYALTWRDVGARRPEAALALWRPVPPPGFVALGLVAGVGSEPPPRGAARCVRADATALPPPHAARVVVRLPACGSRPSLTLWGADAATGAVAVGPAGGGPPPAHDLPVLALGAPPPEAAGGASLVVRCDGVSVDLDDGAGRPLAALRLGAIDAGGRRAPGGALQAYAGVSAELWAFNPGAGPAGDWEPVLESAPLIVKADALGGGRGGGAGASSSSATPPSSINVTVKAAGDTLRATASFAAAAGALRARRAWAAGSAAALRRRGVPSLVVNALGAPADLLVVGPGQRTLLALPASGDAVAAPAPPLPAPPPLPRAACAPADGAAADAAPARLVAIVVDGVAVAPGASPQDAACVPELAVVAAAGARRGAARSATRAAPRDDAGGVVWRETLVLPVAPGGGQASVRLVLRDAAARGGAGADLAAADLAAGDAGAAVADVELAPIPPHTTPYLLRASAWLLPTATDPAVPCAAPGGGRALRVGGPRGAWIELPPPSMGRAAAAGAGDADRRRRAAPQPGARAAPPPADVVGVRLPAASGDDGVALETAERDDGRLVETLRSLARVENCLPYPVEVCLEPGAAAAASAAAAGPDAAIDAVFEHQRLLPLRGWGARGHLLPGERRRYAADAGGRGSSWHFPVAAPPPGWRWDGAWEVEGGPGCDGDGWSYAPDFGSLPHPAPRAAAAKGAVDFVRRRRLARRRVRLVVGGGGEGAVTAPTTRTRLGLIPPGGTLPLPLGWRTMDAQVGIRFAGSDGDGGWAVGASDGPHTLPLASVDDGVTRLLTLDAPPSAPSTTPRAWIAVAVEGDPLPAAGGRRGRPLVDWRLRLCPPLTLVFDLPMPVAWAVWESGADGGRPTRAAAGRAPRGGSTPVLTADPRAELGLTLDPDGYEWAQVAPVTLAAGVAADDAGVARPADLPSRLRVRRPGAAPVDLLLTRDIDADAWALDDDPDVGAAAAAGAPLVARVAAAAALFNAGPLPLVAALVPHPRPGGGSSAPPRSSADPGDNTGPLVVEVGAGGPAARGPPPTAPRRHVPVGALELLSLPPLPGGGDASWGAHATAAVQLLLGDAAGGEWTPPLPLARSAPASAAGAADAAPPSALVTAHVPSWGVIADVVLHVGPGGAGGWPAARVAPRAVAINATGVPLQLAPASSTGPGPDAGADVVELPPGGPPAPLLWRARGGRRAVCVRRPGGPWSPPVDVGRPSDGRRVVGLPLVPGGGGVERAASRGAAAQPLRAAAAARAAATPPPPLLPPALEEALADSPSCVDVAGASLPATALRHAVAPLGGGRLELALLAAAAAPAGALANLSPSPLKWRPRGGGGPWRALPPLTSAAVLPAGDGAVEVADGLVDGGPEAHYALAAGGGRPAASAAARGRLPPLRTAAGGAVAVAVDDRRPAGVAASGAPSPLAPEPGVAPVGRAGAPDALRLVPAPRSGPTMPPPPADAATGIPIYVFAEAGALEVSMVDHRPEELVAVRVLGARAAYAARLGPGGAFERLALDVGAVAVDDMAPAPRYPVLLSGEPAAVADGAASTADAPPPLLHLFAGGRRAAAGGGAYFSVLTAWLGAPLTLAVGEAFAWRAADAGGRLASAAAAAAPPAGRTAATDPPVRAALVALGPAAASVTFRADRAARPRWARRLGPAAWVLDIASFDAAPVRLPGFELEALSMRASQFWAAGAARLKAQVAGAWLALLGAVGVLSGASGVLGALSDSVSALAADDAYAADRAAARGGRAIAGVGDGLAEGGGALARSLLRGVTGVVARPLEGALRGGVAGFVRGAAAGLVGAVAQPVSGGLDLISSALEGVDATAATVGARLGGRGAAPARARLPRVARTPRHGLRPLGGDGAGVARAAELGQEIARRVAAAVAAGDRSAPGAASVFLTAAPGAAGPPSSSAPGDGVTFDTLHVLPDDRGLLLTDGGAALIVAPGLAKAVRAAENGDVSLPPSSIALRWAVPWRDVLAAEARRSSAATAGGGAAAAAAVADRVALHRVGAGAGTDAIPLALGVRCAPSWRQADAVAADLERAAAAARVDRGAGGGGRWEAAAAAAERGDGDAALPPTLPCLDWAPVWCSAGAGVPGADSAPTATIWRPLPPPGYAAAGDVVAPGREPPPVPVTVYRVNGEDDREGGRAAAAPSPPTAPPTGFRLVWRHDGDRPLALWAPIPAPGYVALGACARGTPTPVRGLRARAKALARPDVRSVATVRADLAAPAMLYDSPLWAADPAAAARAAGAPPPHPYDPAGLPVALWPVDAPAGGFVVGRSPREAPDGFGWRAVFD